MLRMQRIVRSIPLPAAGTFRGLRSRPSNAIISPSPSFSGLRSAVSDHPGASLICSTKSKPSDQLQTRTMCDGGQVDNARHPNIGKFSTELSFMNKFGEPFVTYRVMDENGVVIDPKVSIDIEKDEAIHMYTTMLRLNVMDSILYEAQRQGRLSFYMTNYGEEATHIGSAAALKPQDVIFGQYREAGVLLYRGFTVQEMCDQCVGNRNSSDKGRMMPVHYGSRKLNFHTISSPLGTQLPHAAGAAYTIKQQGRQDTCVVCYFGDGAASEGDFHGALNFAATLSCPVIFFCRNNGYAISTPISEQYKGDGIAVRGVSYNIHTVRCDGNDIWAVHKAMIEARRRAVQQQEPVLVEAMTYRGGHHSTSDDSSRYRGTEEVSSWNNTNNPLARMRLWLETKGWWAGDQDMTTRQQLRKEVLQALEAAEEKLLPSPDLLFEDVYEKPPQNLEVQRRALEEHLQSNRAQYAAVLEKMDN